MKLYILFFGFLLACSPLISSAAGDIRFAPYYDTSLAKRSNLSYIARASEQLDYHLAFALGGVQGCKPMWGAVYDIDDPVVMDEINAVKNMGGNMIISTGGALGPYLEHICSTVDDLAGAYKAALDAVNTTHLDVDVVAPINLDVMNKALAKVQQERPEVTISFSLMVQSEDLGLVPALGVDVLVNAKENGVRVDIVNTMTMDFETVSEDFGDAVISTARRVLQQMAEIWPEKSQAELKRMLGVTPLIGRSSGGKVFELAHARKLVDWANSERIGQLAFWSIERDIGDCDDDIVSPYCSGISQEVFEFTKVFQGFNQ